MAPHRLSETEIKMRIVPQQAHWAAPDENTGYRHLHEGADGLRSMLIALEAATRAVEQNTAVLEQAMSNLPFGADGFGPVIQVDPVTLQPLNERRSWLVRDANGALRIAGGDNTCWTREELRRRGIC